ncbi:uncharacterized protein [Drosophila takahashii]|uniref:uncharacterized protein isoform X2 n=1 Tax=Drosophila takahashii TaxID=29030 RepID=UPI0038994905
MLSLEFFLDDVKAITDPERSVCVPRIIAKSRKGKLILKHFSELKTLSSQLRKDLSSLICEYLLGKEFKARQNLLEDIANQIAELFESETADTYFLRIKGKKPCGLLYSHYYNIKARYSSAKSRKLLPKTKENECPNLQLPPIQDEVELALNWLKFNIEPFESVITHWNSTFQWRCDFLKSDANLLEVFEEFPILSQSFGYNLIENDFELIHPASANLFSKKWDDFKVKIVPLLRGKVKEQQTINLLKSLENNSEDKQSTLLWLAIHAVLVPTTRTKKDGGSKSAKLTIEDSRSRFLVWKATVGELQTHLKALTENYYTGKQKLQPFICAVGSTPYDLGEFAIYLSGVFYKMPSLLKSIEIVQESGPVKHLWTFPFEANHKRLKTYTKNITSRKNVILSLAKKMCINFADFVHTFEVQDVVLSKSGCLSHSSLYSNEIANFISSTDNITCHV